MRGNTTNHHTTPASIRFWSKVLVCGDCWEWQGSTSRGYGVFSLTHRKMVPAHRFAYERVYGPIPQGLFVCHHCDNRRCVRPDHLFLGTCKNNSDDKCAKGRQPRGETHGYATLSWDQVRLMRAIYRQGGITQTTLGQQFGVDQTTVSLIVSGKTWKEQS